MKTIDFLTRLSKVKNLYARSDFCPLLLQYKFVLFSEGKKEPKYWAGSTYIVYILLTVHKFKGFHQVSCPEEIYLLVTFFTFPQEKCCDNNLKFNIPWFIHPLLFIPLFRREEKSQGCDLQ